MKLTTILLFIALVQASAAGYGQKITMRERNADIEKVLKIIKEQSGYHFFYNRDDLPKTTVTVEINNANIEEALKVSLEDLPLNYKIVKNNVFLTKKTPSLINRIKNTFNIQDIIRGKVVDEEGNPVVGATISEQGTDNRVIAGEDGSFMLSNVGKSATLLITFIGYKPFEYKITDKRTGLLIVLSKSITELKEVDIVSTGYQTLPKERATGSFDKISNATFNRNVSTDIISRLEGLNSGILFDKRNSGIANVTGLTIRGISTLFANTTPLIVVDNFPYDGDINNINPNDVENITILKDAAAASIWGVRAGNGVVVITTKKSALQQSLKVNINSNLTIEHKPDLMRIPMISTADYIEVEKMLYSKGFYNSSINNTRTYPVISPVVELLIKNNDAARAQIESLKQYDIRNDFLKYVYREPIRQQYALNLSKGNKSISYLISAGYDKNLSNIINTDNDRLSLRGNTTFVPTKNLEIQTNILYTLSNSNRIGTNSNLAYGAVRSSSTRSVYPYVRLADEFGNPLTIPKEYRDNFVQQNSGIGLLDWTYNPLQDITDSYNKAKAKDLLLNLSANYKFNSIFSADVKYQYENTNSVENNYQGPGTFYTRNLINRYTQIVGGQIINNIPLGGILNKSDGDFESYNIRGQLNANKTWTDKHELSAIAGIELKQNHSTGDSFLTYGYNPDILTFQNVDFVTQYPIYKQLAFPRSIPNTASFSDILNRYTSIYANAAYTYNSLYTLSLSARKDASNLFGVDANKRGVPLWSAGLSWNLSNENFYKIDWLPYLKVRSTYGYNGNLNSNLSAYTIIRNMPSNPVTNASFADVINPPNPNLKWEKIGIANFGIDFRLKNDKLSGSIEYYVKSAKDLLAPTPIESTTGVTFVTRNSANVRSQGIDLTLNSTNIFGPFTWNSTFIYSYTQNKVLKYIQKFSSGSSYIQIGSFSPINPIEGKPAYAIFAYKWAGLDPKNGDPQGYLNGNISKNYTALSNVGINDIEYIGSAIPTSFGAFRNTFLFKSIAISANITYRLGYFFRRQALSYANLYNNGVGTPDFEKRWQKPGDELVTNVPSMIYPNNGNRDNFYAGSAILIEKGDHIRLQDINLSYLFKQPQWGIKNLKLFINANNLGILWRANKLNIDPDYDSKIYPAPRTISFGLNASL